MYSKAMFEFTKWQEEREREKAVSTPLQLLHRMKRNYFRQICWALFHVSRAFWAHSQFQFLHRFLSVFVLHACLRFGINKFSFHFFSLLFAFASFGSVAFCFVYWTACLCLVSGVIGTCKYFMANDWIIWCIEKYSTKIDGVGGIKNVRTTQTERMLEFLKSIFNIDSFLLCLASRHKRKLTPFSLVALIMLILNDFNGFCRPRKRFMLNNKKNSHSQKVCFFSSSLTLVVMLRHLDWYKKKNQKCNSIDIFKRMRKTTEMEQSQRLNGDDPNEIWNI